MAVTSGQVDAAGQAQGELGEGPCFDVARAERSYQVVDMRAETRWPGYAPRARQLGIGAMLGIQLFVDHDTLAVLDLYSPAPYGFTTTCEQVGEILGSYAAVALAGSRAGDELRIRR